MKQGAHRIRRLVEHPVTKLLVGLTLLITAGVEAAQGISDVGAHHGVMLLGLIHALSAVPDLLEGLSHGADLVLPDDKKEG